MHKIIECFDPIKKIFGFGCHKVRITANDVNGIFGLPSSGSKIKLFKRCTPLPSNSFIHRNLNTNGRLTRKMLEARLHFWLKGKHGQNDEDVVKIVCLLICTSLLFANKKEIYLGILFVCLKVFLLFGTAIGRKLLLNL